MWGLLCGLEHFFPIHFDWLREFESFVGVGVVTIAEKNTVCKKLEITES